MEKQYKATIITPFHNTDMSLFNETYKSVKKQTIGFENIEWIIILHNCDKKYVDEVNELLGEYDNVYLKELYNDAKNASSPRNYAFQFVTSPYVEFLDSDDYINPKTVETCIDEMEKHHPDLVIFRMAYHKQNDRVQSVITDVTLWNPLEEEIVLEGEELRRKELFSSINLTTHCRFFLADFLRSHKLTFDEQIKMAEDAYFTISAYALAKKIVVLPNFIGHYYYVNEKSAVQSVQNLSPEAIIQFSYGYKKIFDRALEMKAYTNYIFLTFLTGYIKQAYSCPSFSYEDWMILQKEMAPYAKMVTPPPVSKLFTQEEGQLLYEFVVSNILEDYDPDDKDYYNGIDTLLLALRSNQETDFGRFYGFKNIKTINDFRKCVPIYTPHDYEKLVRMDTEVGEQGVITYNPIRAYAYNFNEAENMHTIPVSEKMCNKMGQKCIENIVGETTFLMIESMPKIAQLNDGTYYDSHVGIRMRSALSSYFLSFQGFDAVLTAPIGLIFPSVPVQTDYLNLLMALRYSNLTQIYASNTWVVLNYIEMLLKNGEDLCRDIEQGTISVPHDENEQIYKEIAVKNMPNPSRAAHIRAALAKEDKSDLLLQIWPELKRIRAHSTGKYKFYSKKVRRYTGNVPLVTKELVEPFGLIGKKVQDGDIFKLTTEDVFYEFLPTKGSDAHSTVLLTEAEPGQEYALVVTNGDGIYRLRTSVYVRVVENTLSGLLFEESQRPLFGDGKLIMNGDVFEDILEECIGDRLYDYFCYYNKTGNRVEVLIEPETEDNLIDYSEALEQMLSQNEEYSFARKNGLNACRVRPIDKETHLLWRDVRRKKYNAPEDCFPPIHFISEGLPVLKRWTNQE